MSTSTETACLLSWDAQTPCCLAHRAGGECSSHVELGRLGESVQDLFLGCSLGLCPGPLPCSQDLTRQQPNGIKLEVVHV